MSRLTELFDEIYQTNPNDLPVERTVAEHVVKALFLELVGENEPDGCSCTGSDCGDYLRPAVANGLREELREKINQL